MEEEIIATLTDGEHVVATGVRTLVKCRFTRSGMVDWSGECSLPAGKVKPRATYKLTATDGRTGNIFFTTLGDPLLFTFESTFG